MKKLLAAIAAFVLVSACAQAQSLSVLTGVQYVKTGQWTDLGPGPLAVSAVQGSVMVYAPVGACPTSGAPPAGMATLNITNDAMPFYTFNRICAYGIGSGGTIAARPLQGLSASPFVSAQPIVVGAVPRLAQVTNRVGIPNQVSGSNTQGGWRAWQSAYDDLSAIQVCYFNGKILSGAGETGAGAAGTYRTAYEYPYKSGNYVDIPAGGVTTGLVLADNAYGCTDLFQLPTPIKAFTKFRLSGDATGGASFRMPALGWSDACDRSGGDEFQSGAAGYNHYKDTTVIGAGGAQCYQPALVLGYTRKNVVAVIGDSIAAGVNDQGHDQSGGRGMFGRALAALGPNINYGVPGARASVDATGSNMTARLALLALGGTNTTVVQDGVNDFTNARTVDNVITDRAAIAANVRAAVSGVKVVYTTVTPVTTSSDAFQTTANQTPAAGTNAKAQFNDFLRGVQSFSVTCTLTTSNATLASCTGLGVSGIAPGMNISGTGLTSTAISSINFATGAVVVATAANVTGSGVTALTATWPSQSATFPTVNDGLIDVAQYVEGAPSLAAGTVNNGGVWLPGYVGITDGTHPRRDGYQVMRDPVINYFLTQR